VNYLNNHLRNGDKVLVKTLTYVPGMLHYFRVYPQKRSYEIPFEWKIPGKEFEYRVSLVSRAELLRYIIPISRTLNMSQMETGSGSHWKRGGEGDERQYFFVLKGVFDGSFANFRRFPDDASMYLFLWDPKSQGEKGIDLPNE